MSKSGCAPQEASFSPPNAQTRKPGFSASAPATMRAACSSPECSPAITSRSQPPPFGGGKSKERIFSTSGFIAGLR